MITSMPSWQACTKDTIATLDEGGIIRRAQERLLMRNAVESSSRLAQSEAEQQEAVPQPEEFAMYDAQSSEVILGEESSSPAQGPARTAP